MENNRDKQQGTYVDVGIPNFRTQAERHLYFEVDKYHAKRYNENYRGNIRFLWRLSAATISVIFLTIWFYTISLWLAIPSTIIVMVLCAFIYLAYKKSGNPESLFSRGVLNAGVIAKVEDQRIGLLVLAETTTISGDFPKWGLQSLFVKQLPGHNLQVGERVPVTCVFGRSVNGAYQNVVATPISWGTRDPQVIISGISHITDVEWDVLSRNIDRFTEDSKKDRSLPDIENMFIHFTDDEVKSFGLDRV